MKDTSAFCINLSNILYTFDLETPEESVIGPEVEGPSFMRAR